jgi:hypothetical protein
MYFQLHFFICTKITPAPLQGSMDYLHDDHNFFARRKKNPPRRTDKALRLGESKKEIARKAAKPQRPPAGRRIGFFC